jgi:hypothetical protein
MTAYNDDEWCPDLSRTEKCVNCHKSAGGHYGWACSFRPGSKGHKSALAITDRYLSTDMLIAPTGQSGQPDTLRSIAVAEPHAAVAKEVAPESVPEWKVLRDSGAVAGECTICRIPLDKCEYHRKTPKAPVKKYSPWGTF